MIYNENPIEIQTLRIGLNVQLVLFSPIIIYQENPIEIKKWPKFWFKQKIQLKWKNDKMKKKVEFSSINLIFFFAFFEQKFSFGAGGGVICPILVPIVQETMISGEKIWKLLKVQK